MRHAYKAWPMKRHVLTVAVGPEQNCTILEPHTPQQLISMSQIRNMHTTFSFSKELDSAILAPCHCGVSLGLTIQIVHSKIYIQSFASQPAKHSRRGAALSMGGSPPQLRYIHVVQAAEHNLRAVPRINTQLRLQVLHDHVDDQRPVQLDIVQALVLEVGAQPAASLLRILQDLLLSVLEGHHNGCQQGCPQSRCSGAILSQLA